MEHINVQDALGIFHSMKNIEEFVIFDMIIVVFIYSNIYV